MCKHNSQYDPRPRNRKVACRSCAIKRCDTCKLTAMEVVPKKGGWPKIHMDMTSGQGWCVNCMIAYGGGCSRMLSYEYVDEHDIRCPPCAKEKKEKEQQKQQDKEDESEDSGHDCCTPVHVCPDCRTYVPTVTQDILPLTRTTIDAMPPRTDKPGLARFRERRSVQLSDTSPVSIFDGVRSRIQEHFQKQKENRKREAPSDDADPKRNKQESE